MYCFNNINKAFEVQYIVIKLLDIVQGVFEYFEIYYVYV